VIDFKNTVDAFIKIENRKQFGKIVIKIK